MKDPIQLIFVMALWLGITGISVFLELGFARTLLWSGLRAILQLSFIGMIFTVLVKTEHFGLNLVVLILMTGIAIHTIQQRLSERQALRSWMQILFSLMGSSWIFSLFAGVCVFGVDSWKKTETFLPFTGLLLGNSLSGISLGLVQWRTLTRDHAALIETRLAHGATPWEAIQPLFQQAVLTALTPILNSMNVAGIVSLPGVMTGQLLAGSPPIQAVMYQILALFLIGCSAFTGTIIALGLRYQSLFTSFHQLKKQEVHG